MGCDIHMFIEKRVDNQFPWDTDEGHTIGTDSWGDGETTSWLEQVTATGRDYDLFAYLAGVRGRHDDSLEPRGVPPCVSKPIAMEYERQGGDAHSASYVSLEEFKECLVRAGYDLADSNSSEAFYDYNDPKFVDDITEKRDWNTLPKNFVTIVNYCQKWLDEIAKEDFLGIDKYRPEVRLIFWFDN